MFVCTKLDNVIKSLPGRIIVTTSNGLSYNDEIDFGDGQKLFIDGASRKRHNAHSVGFVVWSGVDGIDVGVEALLHYSCMGNHDGMNVVDLGDGKVGYVVADEHILGWRSCGMYHSFEDWVFLRRQMVDSDFDGIIELGVETRTMSTGVRGGVATHVCGLSDQGISIGSDVYFEERLRSEYNFGWGEDFVVLPNHLILGYNVGRG